jgi:hypothetical protein
MPGDVRGLINSGKLVIAANIMDSDAEDGSKSIIALISGLGTSVFPTSMYSAHTIMGLPIVVASSFRP